MLSSKEFVKWSNKVVLFVHNTSRCSDEPYPDLLQEKSGIGFPTVSFLDADGKLLKQVGYVTPLDEIDKAFKALTEWQRMRAAVEAGDKARLKELFLVEIEMGNRPYAEMAATFAGLQFDDAQKAKIEQKLVTMQCVELVHSVPEKDLRLIGDKLLPLFRAGRFPEGPSERGYWHGLICHAAWNRDWTLYEDILARLTQRKQGDKWWDDYVRERTADLKRMRTEK